MDKFLIIDLWIPQKIPFLKIYKFFSSFYYQVPEE